MKISINLLPQEKKEEFKIRRKSRFVFKVGLLASFSMLVFAFFLFACLGILGIYQKIYKEEIASYEKRPLYAKVLSTQQLIKTYQQKSSKLDKTLGKNNEAWIFLNQINEATPQGIEFYQIKLEDKKAYIKGQGAERQQVLELRDKLEKSGFFSKIESPISNLTQDKNINFEFNLEIK